MTDFKRGPAAGVLAFLSALSGPAAGVSAFQHAASGAGTIPCRLDLDSLQEDWFHRLVDPANRSLSLAGALVLPVQGKGIREMHRW